MTNTTSTDSNTDRMMIVVLCTLALLVLGALLGHAFPTRVAGVASAASGTTATDSAACAPRPGELFNPCATLDTTLIDDLRGSTESRCMNADGVQLADGRCVAGALVWTDELDSRTVAQVLDAGCTYMIGHDDDDAQALLVPAEWLVLGGKGGEDVIAVDMARELTPMVV